MNYKNSENTINCIENETEHINKKILIKFAISLILLITSIFLFRSCIGMEAGIEILLNVMFAMIGLGISFILSINVLKNLKIKLTKNKKVKNLKIIICIINILLLIFCVLGPILLCIGIDTTTFINNKRHDAQLEEWAIKHCAIAHDCKKYSDGRYECIYETENLESKTIFCEKEKLNAIEKNKIEQ